MIVAVHLGLRWQLLMGVARAALGLEQPNAARTFTLRSLALAAAAAGVWSLRDLGLADKLMLRMTLDWWNFEESVAGFFLRCAAAAGLVIAATHYGLKLMPRTRTPGRRDLAGDA